MKKIILLFLLTVTTISYSQDVKITKSEIFKDKKRNSELAYALETQNGGLVTIREYYGGLTQDLKGYYIQHFDKNLNLKNEFDYKLGKRNHIKNAFLKDDKLHLIEFDNLTKEDRIVFRAVSSNINSFEFSKKEILSISEDNFKKYFGVFVLPFFIGNGWSQMDSDHMGEVVLSPNNNFFVINFDIKNKEKETHKVFVYNNDFEKIYDKLIVKNQKDRLFTYNSIEVDDKNGTVYFLGKSYENNKRKNKVDDEANYHFELNKIDANGEKVTSFKTPDKFMGSLTLLLDDDRVSCVGFYGNKNDYNYNGVCLFNLDPETLKIKTRKFNDFSEEFLFDKYGKREKKKERKKKKGIKNIDYRGLFLLENGDIVVNAEEFYITTYSSYSQNGGYTTRTVYHYDDIMSLRIDKDGNLLSARNINKRQTGFINSSYTSIPVENSSYFFLNCSDKVKKGKDGRTFFRQTSAKRSNLYMITIDKKGGYTYKKLIDDKDSKVHYRVNSGLANLSNETVILVGKKGKKSQILKLEL